MIFGKVQTIVICVFRYLDNLYIYIVLKVNFMLMMKYILIF